ncbi:MAG: fibronectin type III domain-containing protein [Phycisphaerae bacterium]|nr:fibronectin type III domain-containing protein [Phycisphaerae bacterium]
MQFPTNQNDVAILANSMNSGLAAHPTDFPSIDPAALATAQSEYLAACSSVETAKGTYHEAVADKTAKYKALVKLMRVDIKHAILDNVDTPEKLYLIGWAPPAPPVPLSPPGQVENFVAVVQGPGNITFKWDKPLTGGKVASYIIARRIEEASGVFSPWVQVATSYEIGCQLSDQPRGAQLEYTVTATNPAGVALASNTVIAVL